MIRYQIKFELISDLYKFVELCMANMRQIQVSQDYLTVNGSSIMGLLSLDLFKPVYVDLTFDEARKFKEFLNIEISG